MNASRFDQVVRNRAQQRVEARLEKFRAAVGAAVMELFQGTKRGPDRHYHGWVPWSANEDVKLVAGNLATGMYYSRPENGKPVTNDNPASQCRWPRCLWETEQAQVEKELLATMDEMQKALCAPPPSEDAPQPAVPTPNA